MSSYKLYHYIISLDISVLIAAIPEQLETPVHRVIEIRVGAARVVQESAVIVQGVKRPQPRTG